MTNKQVIFWFTYPDEMLYIVSDSPEVLRKEKGSLYELDIEFGTTSLDGFQENLIELEGEQYFSHQNGLAKVYNHNKEMSINV